ncbi:SUMF1/EgtB/PvdO family nonheme iron enzyme [Anabaena sp. FACHB-1237]|uniref:bifunctional serine/threonine-protein kinase/formylglycine-generating enzyme family protein n=1 Tax=Anabaena sp. FACHB-1237 TaxID=2692769 RepID=UPI001681ADDE|nr:SUMF1/EgtB/PvdO family nonheme iron enzyme [Anabaena sp. FACHB-1237]MBD2137242.1 SUMF1/EgtB/PvdO family nonheme iron enzyme [Anabaena sp. FACHB-1237]
MSQCINPNCIYPNPPGTKFCQSCGNKILLDDRYLPIKFLGEGGFGRTFQAIDEKRFNTPCVIKQFLPQQAGSTALQKATELFQQEGKRLQELGKHSQIPDLFAFFPQDGRLYLVQEFIDGQNLLQELETQGKLKEAQIRNILIELLPVLQFIHDNKVIHRDIKPENIIRSTNGTLFLIDFGVSKETSGSILTKLGTITGTPGYAPPEQFRGMVYPNSDLYSLAVTCIRLLTGHFPQNDGSDPLFDTSRMQWTWQKYVSLSQELTNILVKMLQDTPVNRYQSAKDIVNVLAAAENQKNVVISTTQTPQKPVYNNTLKQTFQSNTNTNIPPTSSFIQDLGNGVFLEMIAIPGGTFMMGSPNNEAERSSDESPQHQVTVPSFFMGKYPLTQAQYQAIIGSNPSYFKGNNRPVENVSWDDAVAFCQKLSQKTGKNYQLPSEAQWEYACRAGTTTPFYFGETITTDLVNYDGNYPYRSAPKGEYRQQTTDVGSFPPNAFGLYDMHGNVWEWCADDWHKNYINAPVDGRAWNSGSNYKLMRCGSQITPAGDCRSANRAGNLHDNRSKNIGFRVRVTHLKITNS